MPREGPPDKRIEHELLLRAKLMHIAEPGLAPLVAGLAHEVSFEPREALYRAGEPADSFFALSTGDVELSAEGVPPRVVGRPLGLGLLDVLADRPRTFTATAMTPLRAMKVTADDYLDLLEEHFELVMTTMRGVTRAVHEASLALPPDGGFVWIPDPEVPAAAAPGSPLSVVQKLAVFRDSPVFSRANIQSLVRLAGLATEARFSRGEVVFERGEAAGKFYVVAGGVVEARHEAPDLVARFRRSDLVCGYGAFGKADNEYVAAALAPSVVLSFREEDFFDVMEEHFELTRSVLAGIASDYERLLVERDRRLGTSTAR